MSSQLKNSSGVSTYSFKLFILSLLITMPVPIKTGWNFFFSHIFFLLFILYFFLNSNKYAIKKLAILTFLVLFLIFNLATSSRYGIEGRFLQDTVKSGILIISIFILATQLDKQRIEKLITNVIFAFIPIFIITTLSYSDDIFSYSGRLYLPLLGSPNVLGVFCALSILFLLKAQISRSLKLLLLLFYISILVLTFSRAAIIGFLLVLPFSLGLKRSTLLFILSLTIAVFVASNSSILEQIPSWVISKGNVVQEIRETGGSARTSVWQHSLERFSTNPSNILIGEGAGRRIDIPEYGFFVDHPHNFYIFLSLSYGLPFLLLFLIFWLYHLSQSIIRKEALKYSLMFFYTAIFLMDTHVLSSQFLVFHILLLAFIFNNRTLVRGTE